MINLPTREAFHHRSALLISGYFWCLVLVLWWFDGIDHMFHSLLTYQKRHIKNISTGTKINKVFWKFLPILQITADFYDMFSMLLSIVTLKLITLMYLVRSFFNFIICSMFNWRNLNFKNNSYTDRSASTSNFRQNIRNYSLFNCHYIDGNRKNMNLQYKHFVVIGVILLHFQFPCQLLKGTSSYELQKYHCKIVSRNP